MSTIYVFHQELAAAAANLAAGDILMAYQTASKVVKSFTAANVFAGAQQASQSALTTTATGPTTTLNATAGQVTTESQTVSNTGQYTLTITNSFAKATSVAFASLQNGTNTQGFPVVSRVTPGSGTLAIAWTASNTTAPLSGTLTASFVLFTA